MWRIPLLVAIAVALALADASIVTLALPAILGELDASVEGVAAVLGSYTLVLALALPVAAWARPRVGDRPLGAVGAAVFSAASLACGLADSLEALVAFRAVQAAGGAALVVAGFAVLGGGRLWAAAALLGFAAGPALGGALTEALDWRAIFLVQAPVAALAAVAVLGGARVPAASRAGAASAAPGAAAPAVEDGDAAPARPAVDRRASLRAAVALALLSAALVGVLFLLVLLLVSGWSVSPLAAAAAVTVIPVAALVASRVRGPAAVRASAGAALVAGGVLALAWLPGPSLWWTVVPQAMAGAGMGLALPALGGELLPERTPSQAARLLAARHAGITVALALLAPVVATELDQAVTEARERGAALVLDAPLPPLEKLSFVETLVGGLDPVDPRGELQTALAEADEPEIAALAERADETLVVAVQDAFAPAFAICAALALLAALTILPRRGLGLVAAAGFASAALAAGAYALHSARAPDPVPIADPCEPRELPETGGIDGALQDAALVALDRAACRFGSSREELALALVDDEARAAYEREYGVDPRDAGGLLGAVLGF